MKKVDVEIATTRKQYLKWSFRSLKVKNNFLIEQQLFKKKSVE